MVSQASSFNLVAIAVVDFYYEEVVPSTFVHRANLPGSPACIHTIATVVHHQLHMLAWILLTQNTFGIHWIESVYKHCIPMDIAAGPFQPQVLFHVQLLRPL